MAQGHFHVGIYQPDGPGEQWVPLCRCVSFFSPKMPSRTLRKGPAMTNPLGFEVSAMFREKLSSLSVRSTCNHLQVSAVHDQPPPEPEGTIFEMATLVSLHKLCKQHSILVDSCCRTKHFRPGLIRKHMCGGVSNRCCNLFAPAH